MDGFDGEKMGQAAAILAVSIIGAWKFIASLRQSDGTPPPDRQPNMHELRAWFAEVKEYLDTMEDRNKDQHVEIRRDLTEFRHEVVRQLDRVEMKIAKETRP